MGVTGKKKTGFECLVNLFEGREEKGWFDLCEEHLYMIGLMVVVMSYCSKFTYGDYDLILEIPSFLICSRNPRFHVFLSDANQGNEVAG